MAKYIIVLFLLLSALSFFVSNSLLVITQDYMADLEQDNASLSQTMADLAESHEQLQAEYEEVSENQQQFQKEKMALDDALDDLKTERDTLAEENQRIVDLVSRLNTLEQRFGISGEGKDTAERVKELNQVIERRNFLMHQIPNGAPLEKAIVTGSFGPRIHPVKKKKTLHAGIDFRAKRGTPIYATADGVVEYGGYHKSSGFGKLIILQHNYGFKTFFAHLDKVVVRGRQFVGKGQLIGYTGNTGISTGPHLHYEVHHMFKKLDPKPFLKLNMTNVNEFFSTVDSVPWESLKNLYPLNQTAELSQ